MRQVLRRAIIAAAVGSVLLTGCSSIVVGTASPGEGEPTDVAADAFPITAVSDGPIDQQARNALVDLNTFWKEEYPKFFDGDLKPLQGGYFSVDSNNIDNSAYPPTGIGCAQSPTDPEEVAGNAFYDPRCDLIAYDRALLQELSDHFGRFLGPVVMAHEFGHAMQGRFGGSDSSIVDETQADCFAGAWTRWVADGHAEHVSLRVPDLDKVINGFLQLRDPVGSDPEDRLAHGSYFDRVSAFYDGFNGGVGTCRDAFNSDRLYTEAQFTDQTDYQNEGNADYQTTQQIVQDTVPVFWQQIFPAAFHKQFEEPQLKSFQGSGPNCGDQSEANQDLIYCPADKTVYYDEKDLIQPAYSDIGDFAVPTAIALPYALAARSQLGLSTDDAAATKSAVCLTGWYAAQVFNHAFEESSGVTLSPGDIDESVQFLLQYGISDKVFPNVHESGFELVGAFREGFLHGGQSCDVGL